MAVGQGTTTVGQDSRAAASEGSLARRPVALLFPGQGSQYARMAAGLYRREPVFTAAVDDVFGALPAEAAWVRAEWLDAPGDLPMADVVPSQILLFAVDYALGRMIMSWGVRPAAMLGHSVGEMAAAALAGVFTLDAAVGLMWDRVGRLASGPAGGMLAVAARADELEPYLAGDVVVGAVNAPRQTVLAGPEEPLGTIAASLRESGFVCRRVPSTSPFHSPVLLPIATEAEPAFAAAEMRAPQMPVYSAYTAALLRAEEATSPAFWARQPAAPVLFWPALVALLRDGDYLLVEAGPGQGLASLARRHPAVRSGRSSVVAMLPAQRGEEANDRAAVRAAAEAIQAEGHPLALGFVT
jgi:[acyl-carrier-protein] S-malonyltransferase